MSARFSEVNSEHLSCSLDQRGLATIRLNRPPANALNVGVLEELAGAVLAARFDPAVKVVALRSAVPGFFSSGLDIAEMESIDLSRLELLDHLFKDLLVRPIRTARKLFVAIIEGHCLGGGFELALAADLRLAVNGSWKCGLPEVRLGGMPGGGGMQLLARLIGPSRALRMCLTGEPIAPTQAQALGAIDELYEPERGAGDVDAYLGTLLAGPVQAHGAIKLAIRQGMELSPEQGMLLERELYRELYTSADLAEGIQAFRERRKPDFGR
jgi:enoyl-CoA hydratase/carnithine racemase